MRLSKKIPALLLGVILAASLSAGCGKATALPENETTLAAETGITVPAEAVRDDIQTVLAVSLRAFEPGGGFRNENRADMLMLMVIDQGRGRTTVLQLNPDTLVSFAAPGASEETSLPLGEVYSYGSGGSDSCLSQRKEVSRLLGGMEIDHYMIFAQGAIGIISDVMGGLEVTVPEDFAEQYPVLTAGETAILSGDQAEDFFGFRDPADASNRLHLARQQQFMTALYAPFMEQMQQEDFLTRMTIQLGDRLDTDLALSQMVQLMEVLESCELVDTIVTLPENTKQISRILEEILS